MHTLGRLETQVEAARAALPTLPADAVVVDDPELSEAAAVWNAAVHHRPALVVRCRSTADVVAAVQAARVSGLALSVRGGGHDWAGRAVRPDGLVVDLRAMREVTVAGDVASVSGGASSSDVLDAALEHGLSTATGTIGSVGYTGLALGGGYGVLVGVLGLAVDNLLAAEVVLADGSVVRADATTNPDLFWALRGAGGNFGVVTRLEVRLHPLSEITTGTIMFPFDQARAVLSGWRRVVAESPDALDVMFGAMRSEQGPVVFLNPVWAGPDDEAAPWLDRIRALGTPVVDQVARMPVATSVHLLDEAFAPGASYTVPTRTILDLDDEAIEAFVGAAAAMGQGCVLNVHHLHGAATRVPVTDTAFGLRRDHLQVEIIGMWHGDDGATQRSWAAEAARTLDRVAEPVGWPNLLGPDEADRAGAFYGVNAERVLRTKQRYDPDGAFCGIGLPQRPAASTGPTGS